MRTLRYALVLVFLVVISVLLLRAFRGHHEHETPQERLARLVGKKPPTIDLEHLQSTGAPELYQLANEYFQVWRVRDATVILERAVAADSTYHDAWLRLIECYGDPLVDRERALSHAIERAGATAPGDSLLVQGLQSLYETGDYARAVALLSRAVKSSKHTSDARHNLALAYYRLGRVQDALTQLDPLFKKDPTVGRVVELSIKCRAAAGELERAAREAGELVRLYPEEAMPQVLSAQIELARERGAPALEFANHALELDPYCVPAIMVRACIYVQSGDFESARVSYEKLMLFDDVILTSIGHEGIAFADFLAGDFDDGSDEMDEAIRHAMMDGAYRHGLRLSSRLVEYLCQLGRSDAAEAVVERWITEFGDVPVRLSRARIQLLRGDVDAGNDVLTHLATEKNWLLWARTLALDPTELMALAEMAQEHQRDALDRLLREQKERTAVAVSAAERRVFLAGYAAFQSGDAETALLKFAQVREDLFGLEFPYHGDPVLFVQSLFYRAESLLAIGRQEDARETYTAFLGYWGEAAWDLDAVTRARKKLEALGAAGAAPQGQEESAPGR